MNNYKLESYNYVYTKDGNIKDIIVILSAQDADNMTFMQSVSAAGALYRWAQGIKLEPERGEHSATLHDAISSLSPSCRVVPVDVGGGQCVDVAKFEYILTLRGVDSVGERLGVPASTALQMLLAALL
jgi:hypothetical protein